MNKYFFKGEVRLFQIPHYWDKKSLKTHLEKDYVRIKLRRTMMETPNFQSSVKQEDALAKQCLQYFLK